MKKIFKGGCLSIIGLIVLMTIIGIATGGEETATTSSNPKESEEQVAEQEQEQEQEQEVEVEEVKEFKVGDTVEVGTMAYTVISKTVADEVGPSVLAQKASGKYVVIEVTLKNNGNEAVTVDASFFKLQRGEKTYESDSMGSMSANQSDDGTIQNSFFFQDLNPDSEITGKVVYDVAPEVAEATDLKLQVQTGIFGTETEVITLQ